MLIRHNNISKTLAIYLVTAGHRTRDIGHEMALLSIDSFTEALGDWRLEHHFGRRVRGRCKI
jgi:hypothetical protein